MPIDGQSIHRQIGENQYRTDAYIPDKLLQREVDRIARGQYNKMPQQLGGLSVLLFLSVLSDLYSAKNTPVTLKNTTTKTDENHQQRPNVCRSSNVTALLHPLAQDHGCSNAPSPFSGTRMVPSFTMLLDAVLQLPARGLTLFSLPGANAETATKTTSSPSTDSVIIKKIDYSCIEERASPSIIDSINKVADTLDSTLTQTVAELHVLINYLRNMPCSNAREKKQLTEITTMLDEMLNFIIDKIKISKAIDFFKLYLPKYMKTLTSLLKKHHVIIDEIENITTYLVNVFKMIVNLVYTNNKEEIGHAGLPIPSPLNLKNNNIFVKIKGRDWLLFDINQKYYVMRNDVYHAVTYNKQGKTWLLSDNTNTEGLHPFDDQFYTRCIANTTRQNSAHEFCRIVIADEPEKNALLQRSEHNYNAENAQQIEFKNIIERFDSGLTKRSPGVELLYFSNQWVIYRVRVVEQGRQKFFHAIEINRKLIPARAKKISLNKLRCIIYNRKQEEKEYCVEYTNEKWMIEGADSVHVTQNLKEVITPEMRDKEITCQMLSSPDELGIQVNRGGDRFIRVHEGFVELHKDSHGFFLNDASGIRLNTKYRFDQFYFASVQQGIIKLTPEQYKNRFEILINSDQGFEHIHNIALNNKWTLLSTNVKSIPIHTHHAIGSKIETTFRFKYKESPGSVFQDLPDFVWLATNQYNTNEYSGTNKIDIFKSSDFSHVFISWHSRYAAAYHFAMSTDKNPKHNQVRIYDNKGNPLYHNDFPYTENEHYMVQYVKEHLHHFGGQLDITINLFPHEKITLPPKFSESRLNYTIGFPGIEVLHLTQLMKIENNQPKQVVVTYRDPRLAIATPEPRERDA